MKIDDFIKLLEEKKAEGFTDIVTYFTDRMEDINYQEPSIDEEILTHNGIGGNVFISKQIFHLIGQKVLVI